MIFTAGNLITLGIVAVALMLYRLADKNNQHLGKLRRYSEECMKKIADYADEKSIAVKNFGIDLDVEKKSAAQYLKNIQKLNEEELAKKSEAIAKIENHIKTFETSLNELFGMTDRVQENLNRIRDESIFVENTGRRVNEAKEKFEQVEKALSAAEKNLEAAEERLENKNAQILEQTAREVLSSAKSIINDFEAAAQTYERKIESHKEALIKAEREREAILARDLELVKKALRDVQENAAKRADKMEEAAFVKLREQAQERVTQIKTFFEEKIKATQETLKTEQGSINEKLKSIHDKWNEVSTALSKEKEAINAALIQQQNDWKQNVHEFKTLTDKQRKEIDASIAASKQELNQSLVDLKSKSAAALKQQQEESNGLIGKINTSIQELQALAKNIHKQQQDELDAVLGEMRKKTEAAVSQQQAELDSILGEVRNKTETSVSRQEAELSALLKDLSEKSNFAITNQQNELSSVLKEVYEKTTSAVSKQQSEIDSTLKNMRELTTSSVTQQQAELSSALKELGEKSNNALTQQEAALASTLKDLSEKSTNAVLRQQTELDSTLNELRDKIDSTITQQQTRLASAIKDLNDRTNLVITEQQNEVDSALKELREKATTVVTTQKNELSSLVSNHQKELSETLKDIKDKTDTAIANQGTNLSAELQKQMDDWKNLCKDTEQEIIAKTEKRLEEYGLRQEEAVRQLTNLADDAARLDKELRKSMQDTAAKVNGELSSYEKATQAGMEKTTAAFNAQAQEFKTRLEDMDKELNNIKQLALDNTSKKLMGFEKDFAADLAKRAGELTKQIEAWQDGLDQKLERSAAKITAGWQKAEEKIVAEQKKGVTALADKLTQDLARLKAEANAFEKGIREEMHNVDKTRASFAEQVNKDIAEIRITADNEVKNQIGQFQLSLQETLRAKQRELETEISDITKSTKAAYDALEDAAVKTRESYDEWQSSYNNKIREMDNALETIRKNSRDTANENDERIAHFRQHLDDIRKEMSTQKKVFDQAMAAKVELERSIEEMNTDLTRLEQKKSEIAQLENQFNHVKRLEEEVNRKMQTFLSEKHRIELMQKDFERLIKISHAVEEKLTQVSTSDDILTNVQVQIRKLEDSLKSTDEKFQRIERKNEVLEETNDGIDRNFKALQQTEAAIKNAEKVINGIADQFDSTRTSIEALAKESVKAKEAAEKIEILDEALEKIEKRIAEMNVAREWLARTETELKNLDKDLQAQVKVAKGLAKKDGSKFASVADSSKGAPAPQDRDNVLRLREKGWTVDEIAKAMNLSKGEVELILEIGNRG